MQHNTYQDLQQHREHVFQLCTSGRIDEAATAAAELVASGQDYLAQAGWSVGSFEALLAGDAGLTRADALRAEQQLGRAQAEYLAVVAGSAGSGILGLGLAASIAAFDSFIAVGGASIRLKDPQLSRTALLHLQTALQALQPISWAFPAAEHWLVTIYHVTGEACLGARMLEDAERLLHKTIAINANVLTGLPHGDQLLKHQRMAANRLQAAAAVFRSQPTLSAASLHDDARLHMLATALDRPDPLPLNGPLVHAITRLKASTPSAPSRIAPPSPAVPPVPSAVPPRTPLQHAMEAARTNPQRPEVWVALGQALLAANPPQPTRAKECFQRALGLAPGHADAQQALDALLEPPPVAPVSPPPPTGSRLPTAPAEVSAAPSAPPAPVPPAEVSAAPEACPRCGCPILSGANFCLMCGATFGGVGAQRDTSGAQTLAAPVSGAATTAPAQNSMGLIRQGIVAFNANDRMRAHALFAEACRVEPTSQVAWLWLAGCSDRDDERRQHLTRVVALDPRSNEGQQAAADLAALATPPTMLPPRIAAKGKPPLTATASGGKDPNTAMVIEILAGFFGFLGIGHIYVGFTQQGLIRLFSWWVVGLAGFFLAVWAAAATNGISLFCFLPLFMVFGTVGSGLELKRKLERGGLPPSGPPPDGVAPKAKLTLGLLLITNLVMMPLLAVGVHFLGTIGMEITSVSAVGLLLTIIVTGHRARAQIRTANGRLGGRYRAFFSLAIAYPELVVAVMVMIIVFSNPFR